MRWQDAALAATTVVFFVSLVPTLADRNARVPRSTSVPTAIGVWAQSIVFASLALWGTAVGTAAIGVAWTAIAVWRPSGKAR